MILYLSHQTVFNKKKYLIEIQIINKSYICLFVYVKVILGWMTACMKYKNSSYNYGLLKNGQSN